MRNCGDIVSNCNKSKLKAKGFQTLAIVSLILSLAGMFAFGQAFFAQAVPSYDQSISEESTEAAAAEYQSITLFAFFPPTDNPAWAGRLTPVPDEAVGVGTIAALNAAITAANTDGPRYIFFTTNITGTANNIQAAGSGLEGITIDGRGHRWDVNSNNSALRVQGGSTTDHRTLTVKNIDFIPNGSTGTANNALISFSTGTGANCISQAADSRFWTLNLENIASITSAGAITYTSNRGLIALSDGEVNFSGENHWGTGQRRTLINARRVNFDGGETTLRITRTATVTAGAARSMHLIRVLPQNAASRAMGAGVTLTNGAVVEGHRVVNSGTIARMGYAIQIHNGASTRTAEPGIRPAELTLCGQSSLYITSNARGDGSTVPNNGVVSIIGGSGGVSVTEGSELTVRSTREGRRTDGGVSAIIQEITGGRFDVSGQGSRVELTQYSGSHSRQSTLRFYMAGGVSNQTLAITDGAELYIHKKFSSISNDDRVPSAVRFGQGTGNGFYVNNARVTIINEGAPGGGAALDPGTSRTTGFNAGVDFAANNWFFRVVGDSDLYIRAERGAAVNARDRANGEIDVGQGANFIMQGRTQGIAATSATLRATGGNVHFNMHNSQFYDFVNVRPGGGRVFALGANIGNTFASTESDVAVWRRGVNVWNQEPDRAWTLIDFRLSGAQLRTIAPSPASYQDFIDYYNRGNSHRMESYTRISGNNSQPVVTDGLDLTNADRHVRALAEVPEGRIRDPRPVWTSELWGTFTRTCAQTATQTTISSLDVPIASRVRSYYTETMYEVQTNVRTEQGVLKMTYDDDDTSRFLSPGDVYQVDHAWRSVPGADLPRNHIWANTPPFIFEPVRDVVPPEPVTVNDMIVPLDQVAFAGTWDLLSTGEFDDGPLIGGAAVDNIRLYARNTDPASPVGTALRPIAGTGTVTADNQWTFTADPDQLAAGDFVWVSLVDTNDNWNPLAATPYRDRLIPEASWFLVAPLDVMPVVVQYFYEGLEEIDYRYLNMKLTEPDLGQQRWANMQPGTNTSEIIFFPENPRLGYMVDRIEVIGPDGFVLSRENGGLTADGRPTADIEMLAGSTVIRVHYVHDPEFRRAISVQFRFADFGGTADASWILQPSTLYPAVRTGTYNQTGVDRFPDREIGDFHITQTLTEAQLLALVNALFTEGVDPSTGDPIAPAIDGLPRGFVPCPENHIQLPAQGAGAGTQLTFPVSMTDLYDAQSVAGGRPVIINFVATLEDIVIEQFVQRCEDGGAESLGTQEQRDAFDAMSFSHQLHLSRAPVGGRNPSLVNDGVEGWQGHRLDIEIESDRFPEGAGEDIDFPPLEITMFTWQAAAASADRGRIRLGTWDNSNAGTGDAGTGTITMANAANRRVSADEAITITGVPSTAYVNIGQQVHAAPAGTNAVGTHAAFINDAIRDRHERDFRCSETAQSYLWPFANMHTSNNLSEGNNAHHTTNWANPFGVGSIPDYAPGRPMDNNSRDFEFRVIPRRSFELIIANELSGEGADMNRARYFSVQFRDVNGDYLPAGRQLMLYRGEYETVQITCSETGELMYVQNPIMHPVIVGDNGTVQSDLLRLMPGEHLSLQRLGGMYTASVRMLSFAGSDDYTVHHYYSRDDAGFQSDLVSGMTTEHISFNRDTLRVTFESHQDAILIIPTGFMIGGTTVLTAMLVVGGTFAARAATRKRKEIESLTVL